MAELEAPTAPADASLPAGTGTLESDLALLEQHRDAVAARAEAAATQQADQQRKQQQQKQQQQGGAAVRQGDQQSSQQQQRQQGGGAPQGEQQRGVAQPLPHRKHCAVVYRAGQKQIVRAYAVGAREELSQVMRLQRSVSDLAQGRGS